MSIVSSLARDLVDTHPDEAAAVLEGLERRDAAALLDGFTVESAARVLQRTTAHPAGEILASMTTKRAAAIGEHLPVESCASYLRHLDEGVRDAILSELPPKHAHPIRALLRFRENTAGSLMDPEVLALPADLVVADAVERVRQSARNARYNLYVVDRDDRLCGVLNMRELLIAGPEDRIEAIMHREVFRISANAEWRAIVDHPGWRIVHALPVVDDEGTYLGAVRYKTLRQLERQRSAPQGPQETAAQALGDLLQLGFSGLIDALAIRPAPGSAKRTNLDDDRS